MARKYTRSTKPSVAQLIEMGGEVLLEGLPADQQEAIRARQAADKAFWKSVDAQAKAMKADEGRAEGGAKGAARKVNRQNRSKV